jgi:hypothetical protein
MQECITYYQKLRVLKSSYLEICSL